MTIQSPAWEQMLLSLAHEAYTDHDIDEAPRFDADILADAYTHCEAITRVHSRSFYMASSLLPPIKRRAVRALYAFCRITDDIVDNNIGHHDESLVPTVNRSFGPHNSVKIAAILEAWRRKSVLSVEDDSDPVLIAWTDARRRFRVPIRYVEQLIDGVAKDLDENRYADFADLASYCYGVASTVGLMSMHIIGYRGVHAIPYAIKLGVALQLTNILRDIAEDFSGGRVYLPQSELQQFDLCEEDILGGIESGKVTEKWRAFMRFQIQRNRRLYSEAMPGIKLLDRDGRFAIGAAADLYCAILNDIERHDYNIFKRRAYVSTRRKVLMLPGIWWRQF